MTMLYRQSQVGTHSTEEPDTQSTSTDNAVKKAKDHRPKQTRFKQCLLQMKTIALCLLRSDSFPMRLDIWFLFLHLEAHEKIFKNLTELYYFIIYREERTHVNILPFCKFSHLEMAEGSRMFLPGGSNTFIPHSIWLF